MTDQCLEDFDRKWPSRLMPNRMKRRVIGTVIQAKIKGLSDEQAARLAWQGCGSIELILLYAVIQLAIKFAIWWFNNRREECQPS